MQEQLDGHLHGGMGGPRYGQPPKSATSGGVGAPSLAAFLPSGWAAGGSIHDLKQREDEAARMQHEAILQSTDSEDSDEDDMQENASHYYRPPGMPLAAEAKLQPTTTTTTQSPTLQPHHPHQQAQQAQAKPATTATSSQTPPASQTTPAVKQGPHLMSASASPLSSPGSTRKPASSSLFGSTAQRAEDRIAWIDDKYAVSCSKCTRAFSTFRRKHHCRGCGRVYCNECSNMWLLLPKDLGYTLPQRTCERCYKQYCSIDCTMNYEIYGPIGAPLVILLHPTMATRKAFGLQVPHLLWHYRVAIPDLPGHGSREAEKFTLHAAIKVVKDLIEEHSAVADDKRAYIIGYSLGAYVGMAFAGTHPNMCKALIVGGAAAEVPQIDTLLGLNGLVQKTVPYRLLYKNLPRMLKADVREEFMEEMYARPGCYSACLNDVKTALQGVKWSSYLPLYRGPVLFLLGEHDARPSLEHWLQIAHNGTAHIMEGASHLLLMDNEFFPRVNEMFLDYLDTVEARVVEQRKAEAERLQKMEAELQKNPHLQNFIAERGAGVVFDKAKHNDTSLAENVFDVFKEDVEAKKQRHVEEEQRKKKEEEEKHAKRIEENLARKLKAKEDEEARLKKKAEDDAAAKKKKEEDDAVAEAEKQERLKAKAEAAAAKAEASATGAGDAQPQQPQAQADVPADVDDSDSEEQVDAEGDSEEGEEEGEDGEEEGEEEAGEEEDGEEDGEEEVEVEDEGEEESDDDEQQQPQVAYGMYGQQQQAYIQPNLYEQQQQQGAEDEDESEQESSEDDVDDGTGGYDQQQQQQWGQQQQMYNYGQQQYPQQQQMGMGGMVYGGAGMQYQPQMMQQPYYGQQQYVQQPQGGDDDDEEDSDEYEEN